MRSHAGRAVAVLATAALMVAGCAEAPSTPEVPSFADQTRPAAVGTRLPDVTLRSSEGEPVRLLDEAAGKPTVLVIYRGGWCPYCSRHLAAIQEAHPQVEELGFQVIGISPDRPEALRETIEKQSIGYPLLSDSDMELARELGLAFLVSDETLEKYEEYDIDLEAASGRTHHQLPVPAVIISDTGGTIRFVHANPDYKVRLEPDAILAAARAALDAEGTPP